MELLWKCAALAVSASLLGLALKKEQGEQAVLLGFCAGAMILTAALSELGELEALLRRTSERAGLSQTMMLPVLKSLGLALLGHFSSGLCRDAGQASVASALELATVCAILCVSLPLLESLIDLVFSFA